jgi:hypothetical protein
LVLTSGLARADVYKYTDQKGVVHYTDKPETLPAERLGMQSQPTDKAAVQARTEQELKRAQDAADSQQKSTSDRAEQKAAVELTAKDKAERCTKARERYDNYMNSQRLYKAGKDGAREYLSDAELDNTRNSAKTSMEELCK